MSEKPVYCPNPSDPIAVVDDSTIDITLIKHVYRRSKLPNPLIIFNGGEEFLDYMQKVKDGNAARPSLVLLDINMPGMNGFETLRRLREQREFKEIPIIIMLTNSDSEEDKERSIDLGADGFQTKPAYPQDFVAFFNSLRAQ